MIRIYILLLCLFVGFAHAKDAKTKLLQPLVLTEMDKRQMVEAELAPLLETKAKAKGMKLLGKSFTTRGKQGQTITQFVFGGIEKKTDGEKGQRQVVLLKKPIVGAVITKELIEISLKDNIPVQYAEEDLIIALEDLLAGRDLAKEPKTFSADNPLGTVNSSFDTDLTATHNNTPGPLSDGLAIASSVKGGDKTSESGEDFRQGDALIQDNAFNGSNNMSSGTESIPSAWNGSTPKTSSNGFSFGRGSDANIPPLGSALRRDPELAAADTANEQREQAGSEQAHGLAPDNASLPRVELRTTSDGCPPRIDRTHNKIIIQEKTLRLENDVVVETGVCEDTLDRYDINKDFLCEGCSPFVDNVRRVAFDKYKAFWINEENQKIVLDDEPQTDLTKPHPFIEETEGCGYDIDEALGLAYPKVATVFADRSNGKHVVEACHRILNSPGYQILSIDCPIENDFAGNKSYLRQKKVFKVDGVEHIAHDCARIGVFMEHKFITAQCQPIVDPVTGVVTPMVRRQIHTPTGKQFITECELPADADFFATTDGCESNLFNHDFITGKSYFNKRYYYLGIDGNRIYCTDCLRSSEVVPHEYDEVGYQHDDVKHLSLPKIATFITFRLANILRRLQIVGPKIKLDVENLAHTLIRTENKVNNEVAPVYHGCHKVSQTKIIQYYKRPDDTTYEVIAGNGDPILGHDECKFDIKIRGEYKEDLNCTSGSTFSAMEGNVNVSIYAETYKIYPVDGKREQVNAEVIKHNYSPSDGYDLYRMINTISTKTYTYTCPISKITKRFKFNFKRDGSGVTAKAEAQFLG